LWSESGRLEGFEIRLGFGGDGEAKESLIGRVAHLFTLIFVKNAS
jgi:hypothetical protein